MTYSTVLASFCVTLVKISLSFMTPCTAFLMSYVVETSPVSTVNWLTVPLMLNLSYLWISNERPHMHYTSLGFNLGSNFELGSKHPEFHLFLSLLQMKSVIQDSCFRWQKNRHVFSFLLALICKVSCIAFVCKVTFATHTIKRSKSVFSTY